MPSACTLGSRRCLLPPPICQCCGSRRAGCQSCNQQRLSRADRFRQLWQPAPGALPRLCRRLQRRNVLLQRPHLELKRLHRTGGAGAIAQPSRKRSFSHSPQAAPAGPIQQRPTSAPPASSTSLQLACRRPTSWSPVRHWYERYSSAASSNRRPSRPPTATGKAGNGNSGASKNCSDGSAAQPAAPPAPAPAATGMGGGPAGAATAGAASAAAAAGACSEGQ